MTCLSSGVCTGDLSETNRVKKQFLEAAVDAYCSDSSRIENKLSSEIVDTVNQMGDIQAPFDPAPLLHMACLNVTLNLTFSQRFDPAGRMANEILKTYEWRYVPLPLSVCLSLSFFSSSSSSTSLILPPSLSRLCLPPLSYSLSLFLPLVSLS